MKKIFCIFLCLVIVASLFGCNSLVDTSPEKNTIFDISSDTEEGTTGLVFDENAPLWKTTIRLSSPKEDLLKIQEILTCDDHQKIQDFWTDSNYYIYGISSTDIEEVPKFLNKLELFLNVVESIPYADFISGNITWLDYSESIHEYADKETKVLSVTTTAESGDWVMITYILQAGYTEDLIAHATEMASKENSLLSEPMVSIDKRTTLLSEIREKHPVYEGDYMEWWAIIDGIATSITYYSTNIDDINTQELLDSLTITTIDEKNNQN